jgi:hypothetical protein
MIHRRRRDRGFFQMSNRPAQDKTLSLEAKGLLAVMMCRPEDWQFSMTWLEAQSDNGTHAHQRALAELERHGYVVRGQRRDSNNRITGVEWVVDDEPMKASEVLGEYGLTPLPRAKTRKGTVPDAKFPDGGFSVTGNPGRGKSGSTNTGTSLTREDKDTPLPPAGAGGAQAVEGESPPEEPPSDAGERDPVEPGRPGRAGKTRTGGKDLPRGAARKNPAWDAFCAENPVPEWLDLTHWDKWLKDLGERRVKMTTGRIEAQLEALETLVKAGETQAAIIKRSIGRGWQSFYPERGAPSAGDAKSEASDQYSRFRR